MQDYGLESRQRLIATTFDLSTLNGRRDAYRYWISRGHSEQAASRASGGYHPIDEWEDDMRLWSKVLTVLCVLALLFLWADSGAAVVDQRYEIKEMKTNEEAFTKCLNGGVVRMEDRWFKCDCVVMHDGKKCPEVGK